jgi:hypothetical protein
MQFLNEDCGFGLEDGENHALFGRVIPYLRFKCLPIFLGDLYLVIAEICYVFDMRDRQWNNNPFLAIYKGVELRQVAKISDSLRPAVFLLEMPLDCPAFPGEYLTLTNTVRASEKTTEDNEPESCFDDLTSPSFCARRIQ